MGCRKGSTSSGKDATANQGVDSSSTLRMRGWTVRKTPEFLLLGVVSLRRTEKCFHRPKRSQAIAIDRSGDRVECANVGVAM